MDFRELVEFIKDISVYIIIIVVVILLKVYVVTPTVVVGDSMKGTVNDSNWLLIEMVSTKLFKLKRFEVVVVENTNPKYIVKRIIALPGERVEYKDNKLYINGEYVNEPFLKEGIVTKDMGEITVPDGQYFVVGDNREVSVDSRKLGCISKKQMQGKVIMKIWPLKEMKIVK